MTLMQFGKRIKEQILKIINEFCKMSIKENKSKRVVNASKRFAIAENLVNHPDYANNYNFKNIKNCYSLFNLTKLEAICFF